MNSKEFILKFGAEKAEKLAVEAGTNLAYFRQVANGHRRFGSSLLARIVEKSRNKITFEDELTFYSLRQSRNKGAA